MGYMYDDDDDDDFDVSNIVTLNDAYGNDIQFEFLDLIEYEGEEYVVLMPVEDNDGQVVILLLEESNDDEGDSYSSVEDEDTLMAVFNIFKDKFKDEFNFT